MALALLILIGSAIVLTRIFYNGYQEELAAEKRGATPDADTPATPDAPPAPPAAAASTATVPASAPSAQEKDRPAAPADRPAAATARPGTARAEKALSTAERLRELKRLRDENLISEDEYQAKRRDLIDNI